MTKKEEFIKHLSFKIMMFANQSVNAQPIFVEYASIVVVEIESAALNAGWNKFDTQVGSNNITYYTSKADYLNTPGQNVLTYKVKDFML